MGTSHDIQDKLLQIAKKTIQRHDDIGDMLNAIINYFPSELLAIFLIKKFKTITKYGQKKLFTKRTREDKEEVSFRETNVLTLNIRDDEDRPLNTMEDIWQNDLKRR